MSAYLVYGGGTPGQTVFHQVNSGGTPGPGQPVFHRLNRLEVNGGGSSVSFLILIVLCFSEYFVFVSFVSCNHWTELSISTLSSLCWITFLLFSLRLFTKSQRVLYKGLYKILFLLPCFVFLFVFNYFPLFLLFPRLANPFLAADQGGYYTFLWQTAMLYNYDTVFLLQTTQGDCYTFLWQTSSQTDPSNLFPHFGILSKTQPQQLPPVKLSSFLSAE